MPGLAMVCIATPSHFPHARVLLDSSRRHIPESSNFVVIPGAPEVACAAAGAIDGATVLAQADVVQDAHVSNALSSAYTPFELSCALKPYSLMKLLDLGFESVLYLDADTALYSRPEEFLLGAHDAEFTIAPHLLSATESTPSGDLLLLRAGALNAGAIAVTARSEGFLKWWGQRVTSLGHDAPGEGIFVDQKWLDLALTLFDCRLVKDWGFNVGPWNLHERDLDLVDDRFVVRGGKSLSLFHFSRFSPTRRSLADYPDTPPLNTLLSAYSATLLRHGWRPTSASEGRLRRIGRLYSADLRRRKVLGHVLSLSSWEEHVPVKEGHNVTLRDLVGTLEGPRALRRDWARYFR
jgi:hypothetical protein